MPWSPDLGSGHEADLNLQCTRTVIRLDLCFSILGTSSGRNKLWLQKEELEGAATQAGADIDRRVVQTLLGKFQLSAHCGAIKRYLLLGQVTPLRAIALRSSRFRNDGPVLMGFREQAQD